MVARCDFNKIARNLVLFFNVLFLLLGLVMMSLGAAGYVKGVEIEDEASILSSLKVKDVSLLVLLTGLLGMSGAVCGIIGSQKDIPMCLKVFIGVLFIATVTQMAMSIYMLTIKLDSETSEQWFEPTDRGHDQRVDFQNYFDCCGWDYLADSVGPPQLTPCPSSFDRTCKKAAQNFLDNEVGPLSYGVLLICLIEAIALAFACVVVMKGAETIYQDEFHY